MSPYVLIIVLTVLLVIENIIMFRMLKGTEDVVDSAVEVVDRVEKQHENYKEIYDKLIEYYEILHEQDKIQDKHYQQILAKYGEIMNFYNAISERIKLKKQEEN